MKTTYIVIIAIAICTILFHLAAKAGEREDHQTINNIIKDDRYAEGIAKGAAAVIVTQCGLWPATKAYIWPATKGLFTLQRPQWKPWVNCWED